ncbi:uncharacterized protein LOC132725954 [Ruditapes philippinarum]|uniref:uncharacterized protein LOC132725954 n=1 Tax=Ruditapes philippinarum TaxID=129788 RepID=UPI00295BDF8B|nr:uncharacterized protein LOC132725954 [Ruditapes philippinarum]
MAGKDYQDLVLVDIEYTKIHPLAENADDNFRKDITERHETEKERLERIADMFLARPLYSKESIDYQRKMKRKDESVEQLTSSCLQPKSESVKQDLEVIDFEYAAIHSTDENLKKDNPKRQETEKERLERIADMFLARPLYSKESIDYQRKIKRKDESADLPTRNCFQSKAGSDKQDLVVIDIEYAAIHPTDENLEKDNPKRQETESERLHRIADMFLARPANVGDKCKDANVRITKSDDEVTTKKAMKKNKKRTVQKQNATKSSKVQQPMEAFIECKPADDMKKRGQHPGCFGFIRAWLEKRSLKKKEKRLKKKGKF